MSYLVLATIFSGLTFFSIKLVTAKIYPLVGNIVSLVIALLVQLLIFAYFRAKGVNMPITPEGIGLSFGVGVFVALYTFFLFLAFSKLDVGVATPILYIGSLAIAIILSVIFLKEILNVYNIFGFVLAGLSIFLLLWK
jgi:drug/metabolite transporter (DMT)-like permease